MLYAIWRGAVQGYRGGQLNVAHLVASVEQVAEERLQFAFTDGHADMAFSQFFADLAALDQVDWQIMGATYWNDTQEDGDRSRRRQAEFLVHRFFPWTLITEIGVMTQGVAQAVQGMLQNAAHQPHVTVRRRWYY